LDIHWIDSVTVEVTWRRSMDGKESWGTEPEWKNYVFKWSHYVDPTDGTIIVDLDGYQHAGSVAPVGFVGQFSVSPGASTLTIDESRIGHFFWKVPGAEKGWLSLFHY